MLIPWTLSVPAEEKTPQRATEFYVRKATVLTPRREKSLRVDTVPRRAVAVRESGSRGKDPDEVKLLPRKLQVSTGLSWTDGDDFTPISDEWVSFERKIPANQNAQKYHKSKNELKLSFDSFHAFAYSYQSGNISPSESLSLGLIPYLNTSRPSVRLKSCS